MSDILRIGAALLFSGAVSATTVEMHAVTPDGVGGSIGTVKIEAAEQGSKLTPDLEGLTPGAHGFHVHEQGSCEPGTAEGKPGAALAAGGHYDPVGTGKHAGPYGDGHLGDLPVLYVGADGRATDPVLAPRIRPEQMAGRTLMVHAGGDNYSDEPEKLGGGGSRVACGVVPKSG
ncbi:MAG TPA: superoxide dismutase [Cu-Zn] SodC [Gammaproteobacteria bacterium]|nr:superoxide dismutase [Cu-Zn] SodC [Gammaproteobacteria bacterium]